jgi:hypothetical protein
VSTASASLGKVRVVQVPSGFPAAGQPPSDSSPWPELEPPELDPLEVEAAAPLVVPEALPEALPELLLEVDDDPAPELVEPCAAAPELAELELLAFVGPAVDAALDVALDMTPLPLQATSSAKLRVARRIRKNESEARICGLSNRPRALRGPKFIAVDAKLVQRRIPE